MIPRTQQLREYKGLLKSYPVVGILGPHQIGETILALQLAKQIQGETSHFDLEDPRDLARLMVIREWGPLGKVLSSLT
ncbi:MAG: hypothetical protein R3E01_32890 [Pirellulaceae bacterium]